MQKRVAPAALARPAASSTSAGFIMRSGSTPVSYFDDCGQ